MCGIVGVFSKYNQPISEQTLLRGIKSLDHRGPDGRCTWLSETRNAGLGHSRLSIIGIDNGQQPLSSANGDIIAVVNGEFYDYETIRDTYRKRGYIFSTDSDSEIIIPLYLDYGMDCVHHLRGEFAFILWDRRIQSLFICRDRLGIKPLVYAESKGSVYVASEAKALFAMGVEPNWNWKTILDSEYIVRDMENTYFNGVNNVKPGCYIAFNQKDTVQHTYWDFNYPDAGQPEQGYTESDYINGFKQTLEEAIRLRLKADVPVGCYLSGGIDSAAILGMMANMAEARVEAFTISFSDKTFDEFSYAREMAALAGASHSIVSIDDADLAANFDDALWHSEIPMINGNGVAKFLLSRQVRNAGYKVVLTGEGADEVLAGYSFFREDALNREARARASGSNMTSENSIDSVRLSQLHANNRLTQGVFSGGDPEVDMSHIASALGYIPAQLKASTHIARIMRRLRSEAFMNREDPSGVFGRFLASLNIDQLANRNVVNQSLYIHSKSVLPNFILTALGDRSEMAHSIEGRVPFLDHKLVEFLTRMPASLKIKGATEKYILREAVRDLIPKKLYTRQKHPFIAPPVDTSRTNPLKTLMADTFHGSELADLPFYNQREVIKLFQMTQKQNGDGEKKDMALDLVFMMILSLCLMQKRFGIAS